MMEEDFMAYFRGDGKRDTMTADVSLRNGNCLTSTGELFEKKNRIFLKVGECVNAQGRIADCDKLKQKVDKQIQKK